MTTMTPTGVRRAQMQDAPGLARTLARAFADDPVSVWFLPRQEDRAARLRRAYEQVFLRRIGHIRGPSAGRRSSPASSKP